MSRVCVPSTRGTRASSCIGQRLERVLQSTLPLRVVEYAVLELLSRQERWHMRMQQLAGAVVLSQSATTRLVTRMEARAC